MSDIVERLRAAPLDYLFNKLSGQEVFDMLRESATEIERLREQRDEADVELLIKIGRAHNVLTRILSDDSFIINDGGYLVQSSLPDYGYDSINDRIIDLSPEEFALVKGILK